MLARIVGSVLWIDTATRCVHAACTQHRHIACRRKLFHVMNDRVLPLCELLFLPIPPPPPSALSPARKMEYEYTGRNRLFSFALKSYCNTISRFIYPLHGVYVCERVCTRVQRRDQSAERGPTMHSSCTATANAKFYEFKFM